MDYILLSIYFVLLGLYFILIFIQLKSFIYKLKKDTISKLDVQSLIKKLGLINLVLPFFITTVLINAYHNLYQNISGEESLPPVTTIFTLCLFTLLIFGLIYALKKAINKELFHDRDYMTSILYALVFIVIIFGITTTLTSLVSLIERLVFRLY